MKRVVAIGLLLLLAVALGSALPASAKRVGEQRLPTVEAWYHANPTCQLDTGCVAVPADTSGIPPINPYPAGTMHVGVILGLETSRVFLKFDASDLTEGSAVSLVIPLNTSAQDGSATPELAKLQACLFAGGIEPVEGSLSTPPAAACENRALFTYEAEPAPRLVADLSPLVRYLASSGGVAIMPDLTAVTQTDVWQVVFNATTREESALGLEQTAPAYLDVELVDTSTEEPTDEPTDPDVTPVDGGTSTGGGGSFVDLDGGPISAPLPDAADPATPAVIPEMVAEAAPPTTELVPRSFKYRVVWFLPLLLAMALPMAYRSLAVSPR